MKFIHRKPKQLCLVVRLQCAAALFRSSPYAIHKPETVATFQTKAYLQNEQTARRCISDRGRGWLGGEQMSINEARKKARVQCRRTADLQSQRDFSR